MNSTLRFQPLIALALVACAADGGAARDPRLDQLAESRDAWVALEDEMGGTYWYEDENCVVNSTTHTVTVVQVEAGAALGIRSRDIPDSECVGRANRYISAGARTMLALYDACETLIRREPSAEIELDDAGVIASCIYEGDPNCDDNCGEGFVIRTWAFGTSRVF